MNELLFGYNSLEIRKPHSLATRRDARLAASQLGGGIAKARLLSHMTIHGPFDVSVRSCRAFDPSEVSAKDGLRMIDSALRMHQEASDGTEGYPFLIYS